MPRKPLYSSPSGQKSNDGRHPVNSSDSAKTRIMRGGRAKSKDNDANGADDSTDQSPVYDSLVKSSVPTKTRGKREGEAHVSEASRDGKKKRVEAARSEDSSNVAGASHLNNSVESAKTRTNGGGRANSKDDDSDGWADQNLEEGSLDNSSVAAKTRRKREGEVYSKSGLDRKSKKLIVGGRRCFGK